MLEIIYIAIAFLLFFAQLKNGFFTALLTATFWPIVIFVSAVIILFNIFFVSIRKKDPYKELEKELHLRKIYRSYLIFNSDSFRSEYLPEHLKFIEKTIDGKEIAELPNLDDSNDYLLFLDAISRFMEDHDIVHQTMKGWYVRPKSQRGTWL